MIFKLVAIIFVASTQAVDFSCPTNKITPAVLNGNLPFGATNLTLVPINTNCSFSFDIPNGYALRILFSTDFQSINDTIQVVDNTNKVRDLPHNGKPIFDSPVWLPAITATIKIKTISGASKFFASYQYVFLNDYQQVKKSTGEYFALSLLSTKSFYTFTSSSKDLVAVTYGKQSRSDVDDELDRIFVYDGEDISTSKMIGSLLDIGDSVSATKSSKNSITLVNFYRTKSSSYVIGNDASSLKDFFRYSLIMTSGGSGTRGTLGDFTGLNAGYTFICTDCNNFYLTQFIFDGDTFVNVAYAKFQGQTPTHRREKLINYEPMTYTSNQMPQLIPSDTFTLTIHVCKINFTITTVNDETAWRKPYKGRKGYIFSPTLWNNIKNSNNFNYEFRNDTQLYKYEVSMDKMNFGASNDKLTVQVGSGTGTPAVDNVYSQNKNAEKVSSNGNYLKIGLAGSPNDDIRISFEIKEASSAGAIGVLVSLIVTFLYNF